MSVGGVLSYIVCCRDEVMQLDLQEDRAAEYTELLSTLDKVMFITENTNNTNYQDFLQTSRLVPSFYDRRPYFGLISKDNNSLPESEEVSYQLMARKLFSSRIREEVARIKVNHLLSVFFSTFICRTLARSWRSTER